MRFTVVTLFPELIAAFCEVGVVGRAFRRGIVEIATQNPREYATDRRGTVDDAPYGGGPGMVMTVPPLRAAIAAARASSAQSHALYLSPQGRPLTQGGVDELAQRQHLILVAGRYEGIDERLIARDIDAEWSVGDYVVSGGEIPAMLMIDAITRTYPGTLGDDTSIIDESFSDNLLDFPQYTRPETIDGQSVPHVLLGGDHAKIARWRRKQRLGRTYLKRRDLLATVELSADDEILLKEFLEEI